MTAIESAIRDAVEKGGYGIQVRPYIKPLVADASVMEPETKKEMWDFVKKEKLEERIFLDPSFWQALGRLRGWDEGEHEDETYIYAPVEMEMWRWKWHRFIDHLAGGGDAESFFKIFL